MELARYNAIDEQFTEITVFGKPALFHDMRIDRDSVPKGLFLYEVRYDDMGRGEPVQIAKRIMINHLGSIITREPIQLSLSGYRDIDPVKEWGYTDGDCRTVEEFMKKYP